MKCWIRGIRSKSLKLVAPDPSPRYDEIFFKGQQWLDELAGGNMDRHKDFETAEKKVQATIREVLYHVSIGSLWHVDEVVPKIMAALTTREQAVWTDAWATESYFKAMEECKECKNG